MKTMRRSRKPEGLQASPSALWRSPEPTPAHLQRLLGAALMALSLAAQAAPAPWFWWESKATGQRTCSQTSPGEGWLRAGGPFNNSQCRP